MIQELRVENLLLIEQAQLRLERGLNVITGETGAGKTVLAQALDLLLGGRARAGIVRPGASEAYVEGVFDLTAGPRARLGERIPDDAEELVLARRVGADGRTRAYLNGRSVAVSELRDLGAELLAFYGQHEHRRLMLAGAQMEILDEFCGPAQAARLRDCAEVHARLRLLRARREELGELAGARERELDLLAFELREIDAVAPEEREHEQLLAARERLRRSDALRAAAGGAAEALTSEPGGSGGLEGWSGQQGATQLLAGALAGLEAVAGVDPRLDGAAGRARSLLLEAQDLAGELRGYADADAEEGEEPTLDALEQRLAAIERLMRKHGGSVEAVLAYAGRARERSQELAGAEVALAEVDEQLAQATDALDRRVAALRRARRAAARRLADAVERQLASLAMPDARFQVLLGEREAGPGGADAVEFVLAPNPGVPAGALREIASGGELSRVMLAIMTAAGGSTVEAALVFDEVDAGVGGHTARVVGERLRALAGRRQVVCITHLPQIASLGDRHFAIAKDTSADPTVTTVIQLDEPAVVSELVRMLGAAEDDATARRHARDLRRAA